MLYTTVDFSILLLKLLKGQHMPWDPKHTAPLHSGAERHLSRASCSLQSPAHSGASWTRVIRNCFAYPGETCASVQSSLYEKMSQWNYLYFNLSLLSPVLQLWVLMGTIWQWVSLAWDFWRQMSPVKAEVKVALEYFSLFWGTVQQQALILLAFAADTFIGTLLVPFASFARLNCRWALAVLTPSLHAWTMSLYSSRAEFSTELIRKSLVSSHAIIYENI